MVMGLVGKKLGMTRIFTEHGRSIPVTVIEATPNRVTQVRTEDKEGYFAIQTTTGSRRANRVSKAMKGHFAKAGVEAGRGVWEFRLTKATDQDMDIQTGHKLTVEMFKPGEYVDVCSYTKGKGFQGGIKRHHFSHQDYTHGNSLSHRALGSTGQNQTPGRVFKGKKMAGQMGSVRNTTQNLEVIRVDREKNLILVKGSVSGANTTDIIVKPALKKTKAT